MTFGRVVRYGAGLALFASVSATPLPAAQIDARSVFEEGNRLYREADYEGALRQYQIILDSGRESGQLYYNVGNCYFKLGDLGRSILNYERALRLRPRDADARANLELARSLIADDVTPLPRFWFLRFVNWWTHLIPRSLLLPSLALAYVGTTLCMIATVLTRRTQIERWTRRIAIVFGCVCLLLAINLAVVELGVGKSPHAVILVDEAFVQSAPSDDRSLQLFSIHEGTKVRIDQRSGAWAEVVLADGKVGWVKAEVLGII